MDHCDAFSAEEVVDGDEAESSHEQYQLFTAFREFIDKDLLGEWLAAQGLSYSDFTEACIDAVDTSEAASQWIGILSASFEFPLFVQIMRVAKLKLENLGDPRNIPPPPEEPPPPPPPPLEEGKGADTDGGGGGGGDITVTAGAGLALLEEVAAGEDDGDGVEGKAAESKSAAPPRRNKK